MTGVEKMGWLSSIEAYERLVGRGSSMQAGKHHLCQFVQHHVMYYLSSLAFEQSRALPARYTSE